MDNQTGNLQLPSTGMPDLDPLRLRKAQMLAGLLRQPVAQSSDLMNQIGLSAPGMGQSADDDGALLPYAGLDGSLAGVTGPDTDDGQADGVSQVPPPQAAGASRIAQSAPALTIAAAQRTSQPSAPNAPPASVQTVNQQQAPQQPLLDPNDWSHMLARIPNLPRGVVNKAYALAMGGSDAEVAQAQFLANLLPDSTGIPQKINKAVDDAEKAYQTSRGPDAGYDLTRGIGQAVLAPENALGIGLGPKEVTEYLASKGYRWINKIPPEQRPAVIGSLLRLMRYGGSASGLTQPHPNQAQQP